MPTYLQALRLLETHHVSFISDGSLYAKHQQLLSCKQVLGHVWGNGVTFHRQSVTTILLMGIFVAVRIAIRADECLDGDEIFSLEVARQSWIQLWQAAANDVSHPPLFYALLKLWIGLGGESLSWLRLLPVLTAIAALVPLWGLCTACGLRREEKNLTLALMSLNGFVLFYSLQLRMYSLLLFTSLCSLWAFVSWLQAARNDWRAFWVLLIANILVIYSHYWGWMLVGCQGLYLLAFVRSEVLKFSLITGMLLISYIPWFVAVVQGASRIGSFTSQIAWITPPVLADAIWFFSGLLGRLPFRHTTLLGLALSGIPVMLWLWGTIRRRESGELLRLLLWFGVLPVVLTFILSLVLKQSVWAERSLIICAVPYQMLISIAACRLPGNNRYAVLMALFVWVMISGMYYLSEPHKLPWESLVTQIARAESGAKAPVPIYTVEGYVTDPLRYFSAAQGMTNSLLIQQIDPQKIAHINDLNCWIIYREFRGKVLLLDRHLEEVLDNERYRIVEVIHIDRGPVSIRAAFVTKR